MADKSIDMVETEVVCMNDRSSCSSTADVEDGAAGYTIQTNKKNAKANERKRDRDEQSPDDVTLTPKCSKIDKMTIINNVLFLKGKSVNIRDINPLTVKKCLLRADRSLKNDQIKYLKDAIRIECEDNDQKSLLMKIHDFENIEIITSEHNMLSRVKVNEFYDRVIIFGVDTDITEATICEYAGATTARRLLKKSDSGAERIPTGSVVLSFSRPPAYDNYDWI